jgi:hypothetical protein
MPIARFSNVLGHDTLQRLSPHPDVKVLIHLAESETVSTRFCALIDGYLYLANQV